MRWRGWAWAVALSGCVDPLPAVDGDAGVPLAVGEDRAITVHALRLDVTGFEERIDLERLATVPPDVLDRVWLLDLDLAPLVDNALGILRDMPSRDARALPVSAQNMRTLLRTTPDNVTLKGTVLEELVGVAGAIGIPPAHALAELLAVAPSDEILSPAVVTEVVVESLFGTHPNLKTRPGRVDADHPDGLWPVTPNHLPISLGDIVRGFRDLPVRYGPALTEDEREHPGAIEDVDAEAIDVLGPGFAMAVQVDGNALPMRGVDLTDVSQAAVTSTRAQIDTLFPTDRPDWLRIDGLVPEPALTALSLRVQEDALFHPAGTSRDPAPKGGSSVWDLDPWVFESIAAEAGYRTLASAGERCIAYDLATGTEAFRGCIDATGWATFSTFNGLGSPPPPVYVWELVSEIAQVRLHDGGLPEGGADIALTLRDVPIGLSSEALAEAVAHNLAQDPTVLEELAAALTENGRGAPDLVYVRDTTRQVDELWFVTPEDIPTDAEGLPLRSYAYATPGFFDDEALTIPRSVLRASGHPAVEIAPGDVLFTSDDDARVYRIVVGDKPGVHTIGLQVTRLR